MLEIKLNLADMVDFLLKVQRYILKTYRKIDTLF